MPSFSKNELYELKDYLYNSCIHDGKLESVEYKYGEDIFTIKLYNTFFDVKMLVVFHGVKNVLTIKGDMLGDYQSIVILFVQDDLSYLCKCIPNCSEVMEDSLYLILQTFSGDELHIVSKEVNIEIVE